MEKDRLRERRIRRKRNSIIVFNAEGNNKTEKLYFSNFSSRNTRIECAKGNSTDPKAMLNELISYCKENDIKKEYGDKLYLFIDTDLNNDKIEQIQSIKDKCDKYGIEIILSIPTFEIWYLNHFRYSTSQYMNSQEVIKDLNYYINGYSKSINYFDLLEEKIDVAISNSKKLADYQCNNNNLEDECYWNPYTSVHKAVEGIKEIKNRNESNKI